MFPKTTILFLVPATFQVQHGQKCSDRACPCQDHSQALILYLDNLCFSQKWYIPADRTAGGKEGVPMRMVYTSARYIWSVAKWIWSAVIVVILVGVAINLFSGSKENLAGSVSTAIKDGLSSRSFASILAIVLIVLFIITTLASALLYVLLRKRYPDKPPSLSPEIQAILDYLKQDTEERKEKEIAQKQRDDLALTHYLRSIREENQSLTPQGFALHSAHAPALIFADVPLESAFVPLQAISDRPIFDAPYEQLQLLGALRERTDLSEETRTA